MTIPLEAVRKPARSSGIASVLVAGFAVATVANDAGTWIAIVCLLFSLGILGAAIEVRRVGTLYLGTLGVLAGAVGVITAFVATVVLLSATTLLVETLVGMTGLVAVALALLPLYGSGSRLGLKFGVGTVFVCVLSSGLFLEASLVGLLVGGAAALLSYDLGENAIGIGEQLGRHARTGQIELFHAGTSTVVAAVAVLGSLVVHGVGTPGMPLISFGFLLVAVLLLAIAIHD